MRTVGVLLAAGASRRFGSDDKLLASWKGKPLVAAAASVLVQAGCDKFAAVVSSEAVAAVLSEIIHIIRIEPGQSMSSSFRSACCFAEVQQADRMLMTLGDMPALQPDSLRKLLNGQGSRACHLNGIRTPPALLMSPDWRKAALEQGDFGARSIIRTLPFSALVSLTVEEGRDVDTKLDLQNL